MNPTNGYESNPIHATQPIAGVSDRYCFVSTDTIIDAMRAEGWKVTKHQVQRVRKPERQGYQKHTVWFGRENEELQFRGQVMPRVVVVNSHDGKSGIIIRGGLERLVCMNGLTMPLTEQRIIRLRHTGRELLPNVIAACAEMMAEVASVSGIIAGMQDLKLTYEQLTAFTNDVVAALWPNGEKTLADPAQLRSIHRGADVGTDLWTMLNRVQENVVRGGVQAITGTGKLRAMPALRSPDRELEVNDTIMRVAAETYQRLAA